MEARQSNEDIEVVNIPNREDKVNELIGLFMGGEKHLSYSSLKAFADSPNEFIRYCLRERVQTDAMIFGTIVHCLVLEPDAFTDRYFVLNDLEIISDIGGAKPRATNRYKEWVQAQHDKNPGKECVTMEVYVTAEIMARNVRNNRAAAIVLNRCNEAEKKIEWEYMNMKFRGILDKIGKNAICDFKTCSDANPQIFQREIIKMKYYLQAAMYERGVTEYRPYYIIAADKKGGVSVHKISDALMQYGFNEYDQLLTRFNECILKERFDWSYDFYSEFETGHFIMEKPAYLY